MTREEARTQFREIVAGNEMSQGEQERLQWKFETLIHFMGSKYFDDSMLDCAARALDVTDCMLISRKISGEQWNWFRELIKAIFQGHMDMMKEVKGA